MISIIITLAILYILMIGFFYFMQSTFLFFPQPIQQQLQLDEYTEEINIEEKDNMLLHGWLRKAPGNEKQKLIIYLGGNAEEVSHMIPRASMLEGWALLLINYPGYGKSEGKPSEKSFFLSALRIYDYAASREDIDINNIVIMGRSIGTGSAVYLAHERKAKAVILISPFESITSVARASLPFIPVGLILKHKFESKKYAPAISSPLLVFYGTEDKIIPARHSKLLVQYWKGENQLVKLKGYGHNDIFESKQLWNQTLNFLEDL